jgi:riboflavin synthase
VNLERSLLLSGRLGGHIVYGHVDGVGTIREIRPLGEARVFHLQADPSIMKFVVYKGAIAVDGVSLTVSAVQRDGFELALIPTTLERTTLGLARTGARVNLETDIVGKYVFRVLGGGGEGGVTLSFLKQHGIS